MDLSRQEYPALLACLQPSEATTVLNDRIRLINKINTDIADWLQERRRVEELYVQGLRKLARRPQLDNGAALGVFQIPWQRIVQSTESLAASHETLAQKIEEDVERPLKEYGSKNRELQAMPTIQSDLSSLAKTLESAQKKAEKLKDKGPKAADKIAAAIQAVEEANQQWDSRAPFVFEQLQAVDESRSNHLRDVLTQLETHEVDQVERNRQTAENCLNVLLNTETADEIKTFAAKVSGGRAPVPRRQDSSTAAAAAAAATSPLPPPPRFHDDAESQRSGRSGHGRAPPAPEPRHTPLGGLKRLGTVMNRRKSIVQSPSGSFSLEKKHRTPFVPFRKDSSRDMQIPESPTSTSPQDQLSGSHIPQDSISTEPESARGPSESNARSDFDAISPAPEANVAATNGTNGSLLGDQPAAEINVVPSPPQTDSEGYSERPQTIDEITRAQREAAGLEESGLNLTIRDQPIREDESEAQQAITEMANTLRLQAQQSGVRRNAGTIRGRRDVRNTIFIPNPPLPGQEVPGLGASTEPSVPVSPLPPSRHGVRPGSSAEERALSDTTSVRSGHTLHGASGAVSHPDLHEPGLNASIVETVSAWFSEGSVTKSFVIGELALAYNPVGEIPSSCIVRLENFPVLEKVAANPHFVHEIPSGDEEKRGQYSITPSVISRPLPTVAFKYQVHLNSSDPSSYCPVVFNPAWNLEEFQASVIIPYSLNPSFTSSGPLQSVTLRNVIITVGLDLSPEDEVTKQPREVVRATGAVMYPNTGASFRRKHSAVVWKIPELEVKAGADGKLLARFSTSSSWPKKGKVEAKFEVRSVDARTRLGITTLADATTDEPRDVDPFADEVSASQNQQTKTWKEVPTARKLVAGKYVAS
ncbi:Fes/CIP4 homology domain protein [Paecilomyces variotii No. 5]|uniref:Fes/CIP4 homology domain protein n=1 Tax=Byssochlamys spectabilis (strain No. 5 / NBRC 109023) TaxID=1356009 RepID=V5I5Z6_BYSSN|nr:Fes/CIP4 homology domain protein [Paecilomyces variotii No. 5]